MSAIAKIYIFIKKCIFFSIGNFKNAIYVTNTFCIDKEIHKCDKIQCIYGDFFDDDNLNEQFFDNIRNHCHNKKIVYKKGSPTAESKLDSF